MTRLRIPAAVVACAAALAAGACTPAGGATHTATLDQVRARGFLRCGVSTGVAGFSALDGAGVWHGLDVDVCRAIAAAVFGDSAKVRYTPLSAQRRFAALQSGEIDVLSRNTTISFQRDVNLGFEFPAIDWYDGTAFIVPRASGISAPRQLDGKTICFSPGTSTEADVADYFRTNGLRFTPVVIERAEEATAAYYAGRCDAFATDSSALAGVRMHAPHPEEQAVLPQTISKAPLGPAVMSADTRWVEIVRWSVYAMIDAEDLGLSSATIDAALTSKDPAIRRFVGESDDFGPMLGLDHRWAFTIVKQVGNSRESFERNLAPLGVERGMNRLWKDGGIVYVPDIR